MHICVTEHICVTVVTEEEAPESRFHDHLFFSSSEQNLREPQNLKQWKIVQGKNEEQK